MRTISLIIEHKEFKIGLEDQFAEDIEETIFSVLDRERNNSIKDLIALVLQQSHKNIELNDKITRILSKMSI
jgi:hypothetical protein